MTGRCTIGRVICRILATATYGTASAPRMEVVIAVKFLLDDLSSDSYIVAC